MMTALLVSVLMAGSAPENADSTALLAAVQANDLAALRQRGPAVMPALARLYPTLGADVRSRMAGVFYQLGWKSPEARRALMADAHTTDESLRIGVQYALGRVSDDPEVVDVLLDSMQ